MNIVSQFQKVLEKSARDHFNNSFLNQIANFNKSNKIDNYKGFVEDFDTFTANFTVQAYEAFIMALDEMFMQSDYRKQQYQSKGYLTKTLLTKFGFINLKRRRYIDHDGKTFMFIDRLLGLIKYKRMDIFVIGDLIEESANNSYAKAGRIISKTIGNKIKYDNDPNKNILNRATVRNNVITASEIMNEIPNEEVKTVEMLNVMLDEKFVSSQNKEEKDYMIKAAVVFEDSKKEYKGRNKLVGKKVFGDISNNILDDVVDYIYNNYDTDKLKTINFMGDGAKWIKAFAKDSSFKYHTNLTINYGLDKFHLSQALMSLTTKKYKDSYYEILQSYIINNKKQEFIDVVEAFVVKEPLREETIRKKAEYILNNWKHIQSSYHVIKANCSMEAHISHVFADLFTSRPKGFSKKGLEKLLNIRLLKVNGNDLKELYFTSLKKVVKEESETELIKRIHSKNTAYSQKKNNKYHDYFNHKLSNINFDVEINNNMMMI